MAEAKAKSAVAVRFDGLDGMRGLAAFAVLLHHGGPKLAGLELLPCGFLAVDFFFMLSGLVIAAAYDERLRGGLGLPHFLRLRLARLYPMMFVGIVAGAAVSLGEGMSLAEVSVRFVAQAFFLPIPLGSLSLFVLNGVQWSLFFELVANFVHARWLWFLGRRTLSLFVLLAFTLLGFTSFSYGFLGIGDRGCNMLGGFPRVLFSYAAGVLIFRVWQAGQLRVSRTSATTIFGGLALALIGTGFAIRLLPPWFVEPLVVALAFPLLLVGGLALQLGPKAVRLCRMGGRISYPLYALHLPTIAATKLLLPSIGIAGPLTTLSFGISASLLVALLATSRPERTRRSALPLPAALCG